MVKTVKLKDSEKIATQVIALSVSQRIRISIAKRPYIDSYRSGALKYRYPQRSFTTYIDPANDAFFFIEREADVAPVKQTA